MLNPCRIFACARFPAIARLYHAQSMPDFRMRSLSCYRSSLSRSIHAGFSRALASLLLLVFITLNPCRIFACARFLAIARLYHAQSMPDFRMRSLPCYRSSLSRSIPAGFSRALASLLSLVFITLNPYRIFACARYRRPRPARMGRRKTIE